jgi:hydrogenase maturation factor
LAPEKRRNYGKEARTFLERAVFANLGYESREVLVGPGNGLDNSVIRVDGSRVMVLTADPVSVIPGLGMKASAWLSVHLIASDMATSSRPPQFAIFVYNFPPEMSEDLKERYLTEIGRECRRLGISIVAGHTGTYPGAGYTVVGGGAMFSLCEEGEYLDPSMSREGDAVIMTKGAAIEATAVLANSFPRFLADRIGTTLTSRARRYTYLCSTVKDALAAASIGIRKEGVTSMHDATEGGVLGALCEMSEASENKIVVETESVHVTEETRQVCAAFGIDPTRTLSEGTLLITCTSERVADLKRKLERNGITAFEIGRLSGRGKGVWLARGTKRLNRVRPGRDPYWRAYARGLSTGLS